MQFLKQSTAVTVKMGPFVDDTDFKTAETALTIQKADVRLSKNAGDFAAASSDQGASDAGAAHDELGVYDISFDATDTGTLGRLVAHIKKSGALHVWKEWMVLPANIYDSWVSGSDYQDVAMAEAQSAAIISIFSSAYGGTVRVNTAQGGGAGTITLDAGASASDDAYNDMLLFVVSGTGALQKMATITDYVGSTKVASLDPAPATNYANGSVFVIVNSPPVASKVEIAQQVLTEAASSPIAADAVAISGDTTAADNLEAAADGTGYNLGNGSVVAASVTGNVGGNVAGSVASVTAGVTVTTNNDKTGYALSAAAIQAIWDALTSALTTVGSIGKRIVDYLTGDAYTRLGAPAGASVSADIAAVKSDTGAVKTKTDFLPSATAGTNGGLPTVDGNNRIAGVQGTITTLDGLDAAQDTQHATTQAAVAALGTPAQAGDAMTLTSGERDAINAALLDLANGIESGLTPRNALRLIAAAAAGLATGMEGATNVLKSADVSAGAIQGTKSRITATTDPNGNRSAVAVDFS